ncbi:Protein virilizer [Lamellibrachia satsuma]|nr:Protein virilizer [Lamellibrachia satsuma]
MPESGKKQLLFFDTFAHENTEELNLDLVQFPRAVLVSEVRVVPLGTRVQVDVPGGVRLGATNPSSFKLELFVNNLSKPNASTFQKLGVLEYQKNVEIEFQTDENQQQRCCCLWVEYVIDMEKPVVPWKTIMD